MTRQPETDLWWKKTTVYQIYPRSFMDSSGNGIGDLEGIISKLDYVKDLGVETIWFSPFYTSPQEDFGYDIANYKDIAPEYGTMANCDKLIQEIHDRGMKIIMDLVLNHTSDKHPWFLESKSSRDNPKRDWYVWQDGKKPKGKAPPNNWQARITGSGWYYDENTDQWYWAQFLPFQPDLNYRNPEVKAKMFGTVRFWLEKGADGFRLDIIDSLYEDAAFRNNPLSRHLLPSEDGVLFKSTKMTMHHPDTMIFVQELRKLIDEYSNPSRFLVGEVEGPMPTIKKYCGEVNNPGLNSIFLFETLGVKLQPKTIRKLLNKFNQYYPDPFIPTWVSSNHDIMRRISRFNNDLEIAKLNAALQLTARAVPYIYYGEEIGLQQNSIPLSDSLDAVVSRFRKLPKVIQKLLQKITSEAIHRDNCRTPMQWTPSQNAGFCSPSIKPWLPVSSGYQDRNVETMYNNPDSILHCYKRFLQIRKQYSVLNSGRMTLIASELLPKQVLGFSRWIKTSDVKEEVNIFLNFEDTLVEFSNPTASKNIIASTTIVKAENNEQKIILRPYEAIIME
ncbi:hypothetical protein NEF87_003415 [Candidatus Lokiarchaeum ossiferum]|uniref:Glycosyl hydrolase family 13 catalytic domain-containing protein n=1 Tax=Candidatus Lokiarchaeum ossiferum TaxID=2951803 RepID=A0ABY6HUC8_9ARCH|nr:hypothetical protein NEF87_003415 [Candidatus Lokiarchaeum sp. B-35]